MGDSNNAMLDVVREMLGSLEPERLAQIEKAMRDVDSWSAVRFNPHAKQELFHSSKAHIRLFTGGNRSGKTTSGALEGISFALGYRPWLSKADIDYYTPMKTPTIGRIICEDFTATASGVIVQKLHDWLPDGVLKKKPKRNQQGVEVYFEFVNGSVFDIMTNEQEDSVFESKALDWAWCDEPPRRPVYIGTSRGLVDTGGFMWLTMTPLKEPWIYDEIQLKHGIDPDFFAVVVDIMDNVGYGLQIEDVERYGKLLNEDEKEARLHGKYKHLSGLIYKDFDPERHIVKKPFTIPKHWPRIILIDPHPRTPHMVTWMARSPREQMFVYDELFEHCTVSELCAMIREKTGSDRIVGRYVDPSAYVESPLDNSCWADEFLACGVPVDPAPKQLSYGITQVEAALKGTMNEPDLFFTRNCVRHIYEIQRYRWDDWKGRSGTERTEKQRPVDKDDHAMENLYRGVLVMPEYFDVSAANDAIEYPVADV